MPVMSLAMISAARSEDAAEIMVPRMVIKLPARMPHLRERRSETWPEMRDERDAESSIEAT